MQIPSAMQDRMRGVSWHEELPTPELKDLRLLEIAHLDFEGKEKWGELVTTASLAESVLKIFSALFAQGFPIASIRPMVDFDGDDGRSMAANNSSCFNARPIINTNRLSAHSYGAAIDINPIQNPVLRDGGVRPDAGRSFLDRSDERPGMIIEGSVALTVFRQAGWSWGGDWGNPKDYHHFYLPSALPSA